MPEPAHQDITVPDLQFHPHVRVRRTVGDEHGRHVDGGHRRDDTDPKRPLDDTVYRGRILSGSFSSSEGSARMTEECLARLAQAHLATGANEQAPAEFAFE
ncbi:hypothetical protein MOX01_23480 [Microbacterium oxydans]|nr:hypothetical protein MOX01_23480 [Microbacterium oxydans]